MVAYQQLLPRDAHLNGRFERQPRLAAFHLQQHNIYLFARGQFENNGFADTARESFCLFLPIIGHGRNRKNGSAKEPPFHGATDR